MIWKLVKIIINYDFEFIQTFISEQKIMLRYSWILTFITIKMI
jgi:hypothetical protein